MREFFSCGKVNIAQTCISKILLIVVQLLEMI